MSNRSLTLIVAVLVAINGATAQAQKTAKLAWGPPPPFLAPGAKVALVSGDPGKSGPFELMLDLPNGYVIAPHWHPTDETVAVKSGHFRFGMGDKIDVKAEKTLRPGQSGTLKTNMRHWARAQGRTLISLTGNGPFLITYVNASDDPRQKPKP